MKVGTWYWVILVLCVLFGGWQLYAPNPRTLMWTPVVLLVLAALVGYAVFGSPIK